MLINIKSSEIYLGLGFFEMAVQKGNHIEQPRENITNNLKNVIKFLLINIKSIDIFLGLRFFEMAVCL